MAGYYNGKEGNYTIKPGDTLYGIAKSVGVKVSDLQKWNNIVDAGKIRAGAKLYTYDNSAPQTTNEIINTPYTPYTPEATVINTINGQRVINEKDIYDTGASKESSIPSATDRMQSMGIEYDWTKEGKIQGFLEKQQKIQEARREALDQKSKIDYIGAIDAAGRAEIVANQTKNKMGITGMAAEDIDRAVAVARNARALDIYSQEEMIEAGFETGVQIANLFGDLKAREITATEYQKAVDRAYQEASITGIYLDPIQMQLIGQRDMAKAMLNNPYATAAEKDRARKVTEGIRNAFLELGLSDKGVDTITKIYQEEQLRLQEEAQEIAASANIIQAKNIELTRADLVEKALSKLPADATDDDIRNILKHFGSKMTISEARKFLIKPEE
jgi:murein DD-endopeptidase MepM/ murein hydrolase activator NlpD